MWALDIETASLVPGCEQYALESFRLKQGKAEITSISIAGPDGYARTFKYITPELVVDVLKELRGKVVYCHNALFDVAWLLACCDNFNAIRAVNWRDTMLLAKWILNSQEAQYTDKVSYSLKALVARFIHEHEDLEEYLDIKSQDRVAGEDAAYWDRRGALDAVFTRELAICLEDIIDADQMVGYDVEQRCIPFVARADIMGIPINMEYVEELGPKVDRVVNKLSKGLGITPTVISSSKQLSEYLYGSVGLTPLNKGKTGQGSVAAGDLKMLEFKHRGTPIGDELSTILDIKQMLTLKSKYIKGFVKSTDYTGEPVIYPGARVFGTYTGRFTYSSKTLKKWQRSIATHQLPREGPTKRCIVVPDDMWILKCDASQQELRLIGIQSMDPNIIGEYQKGVDLHSAMSAEIAGMEYEAFQKWYLSKDKEAKNYRLAGKLLNLSCQYRIGTSALKRKFFETYGIIISQGEAHHYLKLYKSRYSGVVDWWDEAIKFARENGHARTLADRRYRIDQWSSNKWQSESSAINTPVQGSAADHKELTLYLMSVKFPEAKFFLDIHDELCFYVPRDMEFVKEFAHTISNLTEMYNNIWDTKLPIELPFDSVLCKENFKDGIDVL